MNEQYNLKITTIMKIIEIEKQTGTIAMKATKLIDLNSKTIHYTNKAQIYMIKNAHYGSTSVKKAA